jgi:hypothetical protein
MYGLAMEERSSRLLRQGDSGVAMITRKELDSTVQHIPEDVRAKFISLALELRRQGWQRYSADAILHRIRWHFHVERGQRDFKCNDHWTSTLARWAMATQPSLGPDFFETRELRKLMVDDIDQVMEEESYNR